MAFSLGIDLVYIPRFAKDHPPAFYDKIFNEHEMEDKAPQHLAGIFAAKEALIKSAGLDISALKDIEVTFDRTGKPNIRHPSLSDCNISVSITHEKDYASAVVLEEKVKEK